MDILNIVKALWDRLGAALAITAGALCLLFGWLGVRSTAYVAEQIPYVLTGGVLGLFLPGHRRHAVVVLRPARPVAGAPGA
jgi:hypothetical protein